MLHDKDIREPLFDFLEETYGKNRIIEEKTIGSSRADIMMVIPSEIVGIEIKSDADTYARLKDQVKDYDRYFDRNIVVVGSSHGLHIAEHVPAYWGIITVEICDGKFDFYFLRKPERNPGKEWRRKIEILWRPELRELQEIFEMPAYKAESKLFVQNKIVERLENGKIDEEEFCFQYSEILFNRDYRQIADVINKFRAEKGKRPKRKGKIRPMKKRTKEKKPVSGK